MEKDRLKISAKEKNDLIKLCLEDPKRLKQMNDTMASMIRKEVYGYSLARRMLRPRLLPCGSVPIYKEGKHGPLVMVRFFETVTRVLRCRAYRDVLREEEETKTVRDIEFTEFRGKGVRPSSFPLSNVTTLRLPSLNGRAFHMVERARERMKISLSIDETRLTMRALNWVCNRFGTKSFALFQDQAKKQIEQAIHRIGGKRNPIIIASMRTILKLKFLDFNISLPKEGTEVRPIKLFRVSGKKNPGKYPAYYHGSVPDHVVHVIPSGEALGVMDIFIEARVLNYDKPERLIKGWQCYQEQGIIFTNPGLTGSVYVGLWGFWELLKLRTKWLFGFEWLRISSRR